MLKNMNCLTGAVLLCASALMNIALNQGGSHNIPAFLVYFNWVLGLIFIAAGIFNGISSYFKTAGRGRAKNQ